MISRSLRARLRRTCRAALAMLALFGLSAGISGKAVSQCSLTSAGTLPTPNWQPMSPAQGFTTVAPYLGLYKNSAGADRLAVPMTWGWVLYSLASPSNPSLLNLATGGGIYDTRWDSAGVGPPHQDGQSFGPGFAVSADGQRIVNSSALSHAETIVSVPNPLGETVANLAFLSKGDTGLSSAKVAVQTKGGRYIAYGLGSNGTMFAADVTTLTTFSLTNRIPYDTFPLGFTAQTLAIAEGGSKAYLYSYDAAGAVVVDASSPGAAGSIAAGFVKNSISPGVFGLPGQVILGVSAAVDPASGKLYVLGSFQNGQGVPSFSLVLYDPAISQATRVGTPYTAPFDVGAGSTFNAPGGTGAVAVNPTNGDVWTFMWVRSPSLGRYRLYASLARTFGSPIGQAAELSGPGGYLTGTTLLFGNQSNVFAYFLDGAGPWAAGLSCQSGPVPAISSLSVTNTSTGQPLASGATVFVGDTLTVNPSVAPSNAIQPVLGWNLDLDYHDPAEKSAIGVMQLLNPDACFGPCSSNPFPNNPDPPAFPLIGPCDFQKSGVPATGSGCWNSVGPGPAGNGDFPSLQPPAGTTATLPIAFEAKNDLNTTTVPLATFNVVWKVPAVRVQNLSALLNSGSAAFTDGSEGHPVATGYKWYFGQENTGPASEPLTQDFSCTGPTCNHVFGLGKGTYNAWLTVSYKNEYRSPDCINPCGGAAGSFKVTVTDFVALFTVPSNAIVNTSISVTNNSQIGGGLTGISYVYTLCDASGGSCPDPGNYQPISGMGGPTTSGTIPAPATAGTWWLRIKATYNGSSTAQWQPNVASDPNVWPISVTTTPPVITPSGIPGDPGVNWNYCFTGGCPFSYTGTVGGSITVTLMLGSTQVTGGIQWSASGAGVNPTSFIGSTFTFTPTTTGTLLVSVPGASPPVAQIGFLISGGGGGGGPLGVSISASNPSPTAGTPITLTANASGGTSPYTSFDWTFGDGGTAFGSAGTQVHTYTTSGSKSVFCTVHDSGGNTASGSTSVNVQSSGPTYTVVPTAGHGFCVTGGCTYTYTGNVGTPITVETQLNGTPQGGVYSWSVTGVSATPSSGTGSTFRFTPNGPGTAIVTNSTLSANTGFLISGTAPPSNSILPTTGYGTCFVGCPSGVSYTGTTGTPITFAAFLGSTQLTGSYSWSVTGVNASPSSGSGNTFTFTPLGPGTATITNAELSLSTTVQITGAAVVPDFNVSDAVRGNVAPGSDGSFLVVAGRSTTFTAVAQGTSTPLSGSVSWAFGDGSSSASNPATHAYSCPPPQTSCAYSAFLTFGGQTVTHSVFPVTGVPTAAYTSNYRDGATPLDPNHVEPGREIQFIASEPAAATYSWNFGDGTPPVTGQSSVIHGYAAPGSYTVILTETLGQNSFVTALPATFVVSFSPRWVLPGLAYAAGINPGSRYVSDVWIQNPSTTQPMSLSLTLADGAVPASLTKIITLSPMESRVYPNILQTQFGKPLGGPATSLVVKGESLPSNATPVIWASTYNDNGGDAAKGTFGVAIPAVPLSSAISSASSGALTEFSGLRDVPDYTTQVRNPLVAYPNVSPAYTNVGFVNAGDVPATLKVNFYSSRLETLFQKLGSEVSLTVNPNETRQYTQALTRQAGWDPNSPADNYFMLVSVTNGGKVVPYTSVKDIGSSDSVFVTNDGSIATSYRVPAVVRVNGQFGAVFRSRLVIFNPSGQPRSVLLSLSFTKCLSGTSTCDPRQVVAGNVPLLSGQTVIFEDFVKEWLTQNDVVVREDRDYASSVLDVSPADLNTDPLLVRAETYNATASGNFGTQVPGFVAAIHGASPAPGGAGARLVIPRAIPNGGSGGFRTNVALMLLSGTSGTAKVRLYPDSGGIPALPEVSLSLSAAEPFLQRSLEKLFPAVSLFGTSNRYSLEVVATEGTIGAYASINDNVTGDSTVLVARPQK